jgi:hypothetical protein
MCAARMLMLLLLRLQLCFTSVCRPLSLQRYSTVLNLLLLQLFLTPLRCFKRIQNFCCCYCAVKHR